MLLMPSAYSTKNKTHSERERERVEGTSMITTESKGKRIVGWESGIIRLSLCPLPHLPAQHKTPLWINIYYLQLMDCVQFLNEFRAQQKKTFKTIKSRARARASKREWWDGIGGREKLLGQRTSTEIAVHFFPSCSWKYRSESVCICF